MGYDHYGAWLKGLNDTDLNREMQKLLANKNGARTEQAMNAWGKMLDMAKFEQKRRDERAVNA